MCAQFDVFGSRSGTLYRDNVGVNGGSVYTAKLACGAISCLEVTVRWFVVYISVGCGRQLV